MTPEQIDAALALYERMARLEITTEEWRAACVAGYPEALHALRDTLADLANAREAGGVYKRQRDAAEAKARAGLALHTEDYELGPTGTCRECYGEDYPCPTRRALTDTRDDHA